MDEWAAFRKYWPGTIVVEIASFELSEEGATVLRGWADELQAAELMRECIERGETPEFVFGSPMDSAK